MDSTFFLLMCFMCVLATNPDFKKAKTCFVSVGYNIDYLGSENRTETGAECLNWQDTTWASRDFDRTMQNNYCRNPDKDMQGPWCIVKRGRRQYCNIPRCASSASFDGSGNIEHKLYSLESTLSETISFAFYTKQRGQNDATLLTITTWQSGQLLDIKIQSASGVNDVIKLQWRFGRNSPPALVTSRQDMAATGDIVRVKIIRERRNLTMRINGEEFSTVIREAISSDGIFGAPENIYIGRSPYGTNGFRGCISDFNFNSVRTLDMAMGSRPKPETDKIVITRGVWEGCLLIPPSDWSPPPLTPTEPPNEVEENEMTITVNARLNGNTTLNSSGVAAPLTPALLLLITLFLSLQLG